MTRRPELTVPPLSRRSLLRAAPFALGGIMIGCGGPEAANRSAAAADTIPSAPSFPLSLNGSGRYLVDAAGKPFPLHGDTAWSLIAQLKREDVVRYLDDRRARGFNTILVNLLEAKFATNAPANAYFQPPFLPAGDYSTPNEAYFLHADYVLKEAAARGLLVLLTPSYLGAGGGSEGWYGAMVANGPDRLRQYGRYLGRRYRSFANILWVHGGDYSPPEKDVVNALAEGIREQDPRALNTAHCGRNNSAIYVWRDEPWLQVNTIYTSLPKYWSEMPVYAAALGEYARSQRMPFFLIEGVYENEHDATEVKLRTQAYQAWLSGACGHVFGNTPIWHFDGPGLFPDDLTWQQALGSDGAQSMTHLRSLLSQISWWLLEPDVEGTLLAKGAGPKKARSVAARASDRSFAVLYLPASRAVTVDLSQLAGPKVAARWYDPGTGQFADVSGSPFAAKGPRRLKRGRPTDEPVSGDAVLILESQS